MSAPATIPLQAVRLAAFVRCRSRHPRPAAYSGHPYTGADCRSHTKWRAHGGPLFSPWCAGFLDRVVDNVSSRGRAEVLRTFGVGIRALRAELKGTP